MKSKRIPEIEYDILYVESFDRFTNNKLTLKWTIIRYGFLEKVDASMDAIKATERGYAKITVKQFLSKDILLRKNLLGTQE